MELTTGNYSNRSCRTQEYLKKSYDDDLLDVSGEWSVDYRLEALSYALERSEWHTENRSLRLGGVEAGLLEVREIETNWLDSVLVSPEKAPGVVESPSREADGPPQLSVLLGGLEARKPLIRSEAYTNLAREVIRSQNARRDQGENVEAWAEKIANDIAELID